MNTQDYSVYTLTRKDLMLGIAAGSALILLIAYAFYGRIAAALPLLLLFPLFFRFLKRKRILERKKLLRDGFLELLEALLFSCRAGRSVETAFPEAGMYLKETLPPGHPLTEEWDQIINGLSMSIPPQQLLLSFANRTGVEEIEDFASVFASVKQTGGNLMLVIENAASHLTETIRTEKEIEAAIAAKKAEAHVMAVMPCVIIFYMRLTSPGYLDPLYHTLPGVIIMTLALIVYAGALVLSERITEVSI